MNHLASNYERVSTIDRGTVIGNHRAGVAVEYLSPKAWRRACSQNGRYPLGVIAFGELETLDFTGPRLRVPICGLGGGSHVESWWSEAPAEYGCRNGIAYARSGDALFGALELPEPTDLPLEAAARQAYLRVLDFLAEQGNWRLLRIWNFLPAINRWEDGFERYARFCIGRHEAFALRGWDISRKAPAACALGSQSGPLQLYFLASTAGGRKVENPRQMPAYFYPTQYGPRSPSFARATMARLGERDHLFISGTASIVGHETLHAGDVGGQCLETLNNLQALAAHCRWPAGSHLDLIEPSAYKVYLRNTADYAMVQPILSERLSPHADVLYLNADICRTDLLIEIEGIWTKPVSE